MRRCTEKVNAEFVNSLMWKRGFTTQLQSWRPSYTDLSRQLTREGRMRICLNALWKVGSWEGARGSLYMGEGRTEGLHTFPTPLGGCTSLWGRALDFCHFFAFIRGARKRKKLKSGNAGRHGQLQGQMVRLMESWKGRKLDQGKDKDQDLTKTWPRQRRRPTLDQDLTKTKAKTNTWPRQKLMTRPKPIPSLDQDIIQ